MKIEFVTQSKAAPEVPVEVGNVYSSSRNPAKPYYRIVVGIAPPSSGLNSRRRPVVCILVDEDGAIHSSATYSASFISACWDLVGKCQSIPTLKIEFFKPMKTSK